MILRIAAACIVAIVAISCRAEPASEQDTVAVDAESSVVDLEQTEFSRNLADIDAAFDSLQRALRVDSGGTRADSTFAQYKRLIEKRIETAASAWYKPEFQAFIWPDGAEGQRLRRDRDGSGEPSAHDSRASDSIRQLLLSHGVWPYSGEGITYFEVHLARLAQVASPYVTDATREALRIQIVEQHKPTGGDAAVVIPWDSLADRLARTDRLLAANPSTPLRGEIERLKQQYVVAFLTGGDNTSVFDDDGSLRPEVRSSFDRYLQVHQNTASACTVREFMDLLSKTRYRRTPEVAAYLKHLVSRTAR